MSLQILRPDGAQAGPPDRPDYFSGAVRMQHLLRPQEPGKVELIGVFFAAGARTQPHIHSTDQALVILEGEGIVATEHERRIVHPDEIVVIPAGAWHWHGATRTSAMAHLSMRPAGPTDWNVERKNWDEY